MLFDRDRIGKGIEVKKTAAENSGGKRGNRRLHFSINRLVARSAFIIHPVDRGAWQDIVELIEQYLLPQFIQSFGWEGERRFAAREEHQ